MWSRRTLRRSKEGKSSAGPTPFPETMDALPLILKQFQRKEQGKVDLAACTLPHHKGISGVA